MVNIVKEKIVQIGDVKIKLIFPSIGAVQDADFEYAKAYTKALKAGLMPKVAMEKILQGQGVWTEKDDKDLNDLSIKSQEALTLFRTCSTQEEKDRAKSTLLEAQNEIIQRNIKRNSLYNNTAESKGEEAKTVDLFWHCVTKEDGSKIWNSLEEFLVDNNTQFIESAVKEFMIYTRGIDEQLNDLKNLLEELDQKVNPITPPTAPEVTVTDIEQGK